MTLICTATKRFWLYRQEQDNLHGQEAFKVYRNNSTDTLLTSIAHCELGEGTELRGSKHETIMHKFNDNRSVNIVIIFLVRLIARLVLSDCSTNVKSKAYTTLVCPLKYACSVSSSETQGQSVGSEERRDESVQIRAKKPLGTDSHRTISKNSSGCRLLIEHKKCFVLLCAIGEQFLLSSFSRVRTRRQLFPSRLVWLMHQRNARSQETFSLI